MFSFGVVYAQVPNFPPKPQHPPKKPLELHPSSPKNSPDTLPPPPRTQATSRPVSASRPNPSSKKNPMLRGYRQRLYLGRVSLRNRFSTDVETPMSWAELRWRIEEAVWNISSDPETKVFLPEQSDWRLSRYAGWWGQSNLRQPPALQDPVPWVDPEPEMPLYQHKQWPIQWPESAVSTVRGQRQWQALVKSARSQGLSSKTRDQLQQQARRWVKERKHQQALVLYQKMLAREPEDIEVLQSVARLHIWGKQFTQAQRVLQQLFEISPGDVEGYRIMGDLERTQGRFAEAVGWYRLYHRIVPNDPDMLRILARTAAQAKQQTLATQMYQHILQKHPGDPEAKAFLSGETLLPRFLVSITTTQQIFTRDRISQYFEPKLGMRFFNKLLVLMGLGIDLRHFPTHTIYDLFPHVEAIWISQRWKDFKASLFVGATPIRAYYPHILLEAGATVPVWQLRFHGAYRYTHFAERQAHLFSPGASFVWGSWLFGAQYYLTLVKNTDSQHVQAQHSIRFRAEWQPLWWLVIRGGIGGGDTPDYLLNVATLPQSGPSAGTEVFAQSIFFFDLNFQFEFPRSQFLLFTYRYYQELLFLYPNTPPDRAIFLHELSLAYRWYF